MVELRTLLKNNLLAAPYDPPRAGTSRGRVSSCRPDLINVDTLGMTSFIYYYYIIMTDERFIGVDGRKLRRLRRERALSQQDLLRITGVAQATLSELERGKRQARASTLRKLAEALGVEPKELMKEE